ncbi:hypothetical protein [Paenibacillus cymbidii]|uniref:hypothetical protein n=1 Tax=Paenibacillus cymbidii TaxID=1639034 RepID=UPI0010804891|nr:hypothetical protein [Paenibacillus cymbidii]
MIAKYRGYGMAALAVAMVAVLVYWGYDRVNRASPGETKKATTDNVETALGISPIAVIGKVAQASGTGYKIEVIQVLKGDVKGNRSIQVAVPGGPGILANNEEYVFALAPSLSGPPNFYGMIDPFIFQIKNNKVAAITNDAQVAAAFQETNMSVAELASKLAAK